MKILHITPSYFPAFKMGGPIKSVHELNKSLVKKGINITVYTTNAGIERAIEFNKETLIDGVKVFYFPYYGYVNFTFSPALCWMIKKNIKNFDLIHITGVWNFPILATAFWARFYKKPYIISPRGSLMKEPLEMKSSFIKKLFLFLFVRRDLKNASALHFTVEKEKEEYLSADLLFKKAIIIPNGIDIEEFSIISNKTLDVQKLNFRQKFGISEDKKIILFLGRLNWKKGLDTLIPAFAEVIKKEQKAVLIIAGPDDEKYSAEIKKMINEVNIITLGILRLKSLISGMPDVQEVENSNIIFTGMIIGEDKIAAYKESNVFILPSYSENFGMAVIEAMGFGLPVVITKGVGISKEVETAGAGLVVEKNIEQTAEAILKVLENSVMAKKMGEQGKELVKREFSSDKVAEKFLKEYNEIIKKYETSD